MIRVLVTVGFVFTILASAAAQDRSFDFLTGRWDGTWRSGPASGSSVLTITKVSGRAVEGTIDLQGAAVASGDAAFKGAIKTKDGTEFLEFVKDVRVRYQLNIINDAELKGISEGRYTTTHEFRKKSR